ncbi:MAG: hypothetical protein ACFE8U_04080 [Candidatus Hermodarchaeota archaeon]
MNTINQEEGEVLPEYLSRLEENVLEELSLREKHYSFRFNGLRRLLKDVHQQKLSRALERLQEDRLIEQYPDGGYGLDRNSYEMIREHFGNHQAKIDYFEFNSTSKRVYTAISSENQIPVKSLINKLAGKYFGSFRFMGHYYSNGEGRLEWIHADDHSKILISSLTSAKLEIISYNVTQTEITKFLNILQQLLFDYQIILSFSINSTTQVN